MLGSGLKLSVGIKNHLDLQLKPINLGEIKKESGNLSPGPCADIFKGSLFFPDVQRTSAMMELPYKPLENFMESVFIKGSLRRLSLLVRSSIQNI